MPTTQNTTLTVTLQDFTGADVAGGAVIIRLCGYGQSMPKVAGTAMIATPVVKEILTNGISTGIELYGNDQISPAGTYYSIELEDAKRNIIFAGIFQFISAGTIDLSNATQLDIQPAPPVFQKYVAVQFSATPTFDGRYGNIFDITLTGNVTSSTAENFSPGTFVQFFIQQDATGNRTFTWPANVKNPPVVDPTAGKTTTANFIMRSDGNLYPNLGVS